jgi:hypothetical protein
LGGGPDVSWGRLSNLVEGGNQGHGGESWGSPMPPEPGDPNGLPSAMFSNTLNNVQRVERCISLRRGRRGVQRSRQRQNDAVGGPSPGRRVSGRSWTVVRLSAGASAQGTKPVKMAWTQVDRLLSHGSIEGSGTKQTAAAGGGDAGDVPRRVKWDSGQIRHLEKVLGDRGMRTLGRLGV